jgi:hypothetical protein
MRWYIACVTGDNSRIALLAILESVRGREVTRRRVLVDGTLAATIPRLALLSIAGPPRMDSRV